MTPIMLAAHSLTAGYGRRLVFRDVTFGVPAGQVLGVIGPSGAGKTTLLRLLVGLLTPRAGDIRIQGMPPADALARTAVAYFAGEGTLPGTVRASVWGRLAHGALAIRERRRIRTLSRGTRQLLGLRTVLGRHPLGLIVLDEPWESLDADGVRWLSNTLATKRDRGAAIVLASQRVHDLAAMCDAYLFLLPHGSVLVRSHEIAPGAVVTAERLTALAERVRAGASLRAVS